MLRASDLSEATAATPSSVSVSEVIDLVSSDTDHERSNTHLETAPGHSTSSDLMLRYLLKNRAQEDRTPHCWGIVGSSRIHKDHPEPLGAS